MELLSDIQQAIRDEEEAIEYYTRLEFKLKSNIGSLTRDERRLLRWVASFKKDEEYHRDTLREMIK